MIIAIIFSVPGQGKVLFNIPRLRLPEWLAGIYLGGAVTLERISYVLLESATIFSLVITIAAASSLANPKQTLRALPGVLHEAGVALIIATTLIPHFATSVNRIREARKLRGDSARFGFKRTLVPLFEESLERALTMAESMEARGYGRVGGRKYAFASTALLVVGVMSLLFAILQMLIGNHYQLALTTSLSLIVIALVVANISNQRTRYRPLPWRENEILVIASSFGTIFFTRLTFTPLLSILVFALALVPLALTTKMADAT